MPGRHDARHLTWLAVEVGRGLQPLLVGVPGKHELAIFEFIYDLTRHLRADRRAAEAAADAALGFAPQRVHVIGGVDHDRPFTGNCRLSELPIQ